VEFYERHAVRLEPEVKLNSFKLPTMDHRDPYGYDDFLRTNYSNEAKIVTNLRWIFACVMSNELFPVKSFIRFINSYILRHLLELETKAKFHEDTNQ